MSKKADSQKNQRIQVFARCRPLNSIEKKQCSPSVVETIPERKEIVLKDKSTNKKFLFDKVFPTNTEQVAVYKAVVAPLIQEVLMGYNCTVFAYGQTGTGKTYTMEGERSDAQCSWEDDPGAGIIPRSLHQLFEELNKEDNVEFSVRVSFLELYNEELFDLLSSSELSKLRLYEDTNRKGSVIIHGLEEILVNNKDEVYAILEKGTARRKTAATMLNASSSRSHTVFSVTVHIKENTLDGEELLKTGKLNLVDLAGSENVGRSGAKDTRAREAGNINQSLLTLGRVITALIEKQPHVPYRESKLTRLLQDSLGGHTKTSIIATISPALCNFDETASTLDYATKAKSITIKPEVNQKMTKKALLREYTEEIERLRKDLSAARVGQGFFMDAENYASMMNTKTAQETVIKELSDKIEILTAEITKIEQLFTSSKEELGQTREELNETTQQYKKTKGVLKHTEKVLSKTTLERDEKQYLINIQKQTEKKLSTQAQQLLEVADLTTGDVDKLHCKLDRKCNVEKTNEEICSDFRRIFKTKNTKLCSKVTETGNLYSEKLNNLREDLNGMDSCVHEYNQDIGNLHLEQSNHLASSLGLLSARLSGEATGDRQWHTALLEEITTNKNKHVSEGSLFLTNELPSLSKEVANGIEQMESWGINGHSKICQEPCRVQSSERVPPCLCNG